MPLLSFANTLTIAFILLSPYVLVINPNSAGTGA